MILIFFFNLHSPEFLKKLGGAGHARSPLCLLGDPWCLNSFCFVFYFRKEFFAASFPPDFFMQLLLSVQLINYSMTHARFKSNCFLHYNKLC